MSSSVINDENNLTFRANRRTNSISDWFAYLNPIRIALHSAVIRTIHTTHWLAQWPAVQSAIKSTIAEPDNSDGPALISALWLS